MRLLTDQKHLSCFVVWKVDRDVPIHLRRDPLPRALTSYFIELLDSDHEQVTLRAKGERKYFGFIIMFNDNWKTFCTDKKRFRSTVLFVSLINRINFASFLFRLCIVQHSGLHTIVFLRICVKCCK